MATSSRFVRTLGFLLVAPLAGAVEPDMSLRAEATYGTAIESSQSVAGEVLLIPALELSLGGSTSYVTSARLRADTEDLLEPGRANTDAFSDASRPISLGDAGTLEILDFYVEHRTDTSAFRLGKQQIVWGRLDGLKILDLLNPQDFREFILDEFSDSRISLWSAYADISLGDWRAELAVIPDGTGHAIPPA